MIDLTLLQDLGLKDAEQRVYATLLEHGTVSIRELAEASGVNRGTTYDALKRLVAFGLVGFHVKGERRKYFAEPPEKLTNLVAERRRQLDRVDGRIQELLPTLKAQRVRTGEEPLVRYYEDDDGIVTVLRDVLTTTAGLPEPEYFVYSSRALRQYLYRRFPGFTKRRIAAGIGIKVIAVGEGGEHASLAERKWLPEPPDTSVSSYTIIYGDKIALISVSADDTPYAVVIEEPGVAAMQKYLFVQLWNSLPQ